jgi:hypothetical protein
MSESLRHKVVAVAVIYDKRTDKFLLSYNKRWHGYAFPMKHIEPGTDPAATAVAAIRDPEFPIRWPQAAATPLDRFGEFRHSEGAHKDTYYDYRLFAIDPGAPLPDAPLDSGLALLTYEQLQMTPSVTASTQAIAKALVERRRVVSTVISRVGRGGPEVLLVLNQHHEYFLPSARMRTELEAAQVTPGIVLDDLGYSGPTEIGDVRVVDARQPSPRFGGRSGAFHFHLFGMKLPGVDLTRPANALEQALDEIHPPPLVHANAPTKPWWDWFTAEGLRTRSDVSPSMKLILETLLQMLEKA